MYEAGSNDFRKVMDVASGGLSSIANIGKSTEDTVNAGLNIASGGLFGLFSGNCFLAGTPVAMANGDIIPIEDIDLLDEVEEGGLVNARAVLLSDNLYNYHDVMVSGSHAVLERGIWKRIADSEDAISVPLEKRYVKVYALNNAQHRIIINGITFADYGEMDDGDNYTAAQRIDILNGKEIV